MAEKKTADATADDALTESKAQVQEKMDEEQAKGFRGFNPDPTPNEHYTFQGQAAGKPTPETDPAYAAKAGRPFLTHAGDGLPHPLEKKGKE